MTNGRAHARTGAGGRTARPRRLILRRLVRGLAVLAVLAGTVVGATLAVQPAQAAPWDCPFGSGEISNAGPEHGGAGMTAWIPIIAKEDVDPDLDPDPRKRGRQERPSDHTLLEVVGPRGLLWSYAPYGLPDDHEEFNTEDPEDNFEQRCSVMDASATGIAQMIFSIAGFFGGLTIGVKQLASNEAPFSAFYDAQQSLLTSLNENIGVPAVTVAVAATGFWVLTRIHRRADSRETYAGVISSALIVVLVASVLAGDNYVRITAAVDRYTSEFNSAVMDLAVINRNRDPSSPCYLPTVPTAAQAEPGARPSPDDPHRALTYNLGKRVSSCMLYEVLLFQPWVNGQFGTERQLLADDLTFNGKSYCPDGRPPQYQRPEGVESIEYRCATRPKPPGQPEAKINLAVQQVVAQALSRNQTIDEADGRPVDTEQHRVLWKGVQYKIAQLYEPNYEFWRGTQPSGRMATAVAALFVNLIAFIFVGILALLTIFWHAVFLMAWIFLPVIGAIAAFPPARRIVRMVIGIMVQAVFLRCVFGLVLALLLAVLNILQVAEGGTVIKIFLMLMATAAIWKLLTALRSGAIAPQVVQEASASGVMPSDTPVLVRTREATATAYRFQRNVRAGARAGAASAAETAQALGYSRGSPQWRAEVRRGRLQGAVTAGRMTSAHGRVRVLAEDQARADASARVHRRAQAAQNTAPQAPGDQPTRGAGRTPEEGRLSERRLGEGRPSQRRADGVRRNEDAVRPRTAAPEREASTPGRLRRGPDGEPR